MKFGDIISFSLSQEGALKACEVRRSQASHETVLMNEAIQAMVDGLKKAQKDSTVRTGLFGL